MSLTKFILGIRTTRDRIEVESRPFAIRMKDGVFGVVVPSFDDWTRTEDYDLRSVDGVLQFNGQSLLVEFPDEPARSKFRTWLAATNAKAEQGYKTMSP